MEEAAQKRPGKMLSVIGLDSAKVKEICAKASAEIANLNCPGQIVLSGSREAIEQAKKLSEEAGAKIALVLEVSGAFHSSFMKEAAVKLEAEIKKVSIVRPQIPVISNVSAKAACSVDEIKENLVRQVASSVLWEDSMRLILSKGIGNFIEFGPGKVLRGLMKRIDPGVTVRNIENIEDILAAQALQ
jgi:[acyl-carrier-protein] S-malonyltransferase